MKIANANLVDETSFNSVFPRLIHQYVRLNDGTDEVEGFVLDGNSEFVLLLVNNQLVRVPVIHIKSMTVISRNNSYGHRSGSYGHKSGSDGHKSGSYGHKSGSYGHKSGSYGHKSGSKGHRSGRKRNKKRCKT